MVGQLGYYFVFCCKTVVKRSTVKVDEFTSPMSAHATTIHKFCCPNAVIFMMSNPDRFPSALSKWACPRYQIPALTLWSYVGGSWDFSQVNYWGCIWKNNNNLSCMPNSANWKPSLLEVPIVNYHFNQSVISWTMTTCHVGLPWQHAMLGYSNHDNVLCWVASPWQRASNQDNVPWWVAVTDLYQ